MELFDELVWRGLVQESSEGLGEALHTPLTLYVGYDPTAASLHAGNLQQVITMRRFQLRGHRVIALAGGGTGLIGDPSGKSAERALHEASVVAEWAERIEGQIRRLLPDDTIFENNLTWLGGMTVIECLRDVGKHFPMGYMLAKESVRARVHGEGMTFTEFSYMVLQACDFLELYDRYDCRLQFGGSDQWGNITAGLELLRRTGRPGAYGMTTPLLLRADGQKFGKSEQGAVWLDPEMTSPYEFFQFFLNTADDQVGMLLRRLTLFAPEEIERLEATDPSTREAQRALAEHLTSMVHGEDGLRAAREQTEKAFEGADWQVEDALVLSPEHWPAAFLAAGLVASLSEARRLIKGGGLYVDDEKLTEDTSPPVPGPEVVVLRKGKRQRRAVHFV